MVLGPTLPATKDAGQKGVLGVLAASVWQVGHRLLLKLRTFRVSGNPSQLLGRTLGRRVSAGPVVSAGPEGVHFFLRKGGTLRLGSGPESFTLLKGFSAQWGSSQIQRHLYCRVVSTVMKTVHGVFPGTGAVGGPG